MLRTVLNLSHIGSISVLKRDETHGVNSFIFEAIFIEFPMTLKSHRLRFRT
jgi:hypothetical protein